MLFALDGNRGPAEPIDNGVDELAMKIFTEISAQYTVRHGVHDTRAQASALVRESFKLAETFVQERDSRVATGKEHPLDRPVPIT